MIFFNTPCAGRFSVWMSCVCVLLVLMLPASRTYAQHQFVFYQMDQVPQSGLLNPGYIPEQKLYFGLPLITGTGAGFASNGFTYDQLRPGDEFIFEAIDFTELAGQSARSNHLLGSAETQLLGFGLRLGQGYLSLGVAERGDFNGFYPADFSQLLSDVQQRNTGMLPYELSRLDINARHYRSFSLGYAHQLDRLSAGVRFHYLAGLSNIWTINRGIQLQDDGDGDFFDVNGALYFLSAGFNDSDDHSLSDYFRGSGNRGFSADLGLVYQLTEQLEISASALNLGLIKWNNQISYRKVDEELSQFSTDDLEALEEEFGQIIDDLVNGLSADGELRYQTPLVQQYYLGGRYYLQPETSIGLLFNSRFSGERFTMGASASGSTRIGKLLSLSLAYSAFNHSYFNLGGGFSLDLGPLQLYAASDNLLSFFRLKNTHTAQGQVGINLNFGKAKQEEPEAEPIVETGFFPGESPAPAASSSPVPARQPAPVSHAVTADPFETGEDNEAAYLSASPADNSTIFLHGVVREQVSRKLLKSIVLEAYTMEAGGERTLIYANGFYSGRFSIPLRRGAAHLLIVNKHGYQEEEVILNTEDLGQQEAIEREFTLFPKPKSTAPAAPAERWQSIEVQEEWEQPAGQEAAPIPEPDNTLFALTEATSLREGPTHKTEVILRFRPGDQVELLEKHDRWWWRVRFEGRSGYVKAFLLVPAQ